jgi:mRNA-degrading endonuclease toxin of MazEF toxin-antitoxin module
MTIRRGAIIQGNVGRIGFGRDPAGSPLFLVLQADPANALLATVVAAPVTERVDPGALLPFDVVVPAGEAGQRRDHVAHIHLLRAYPVASFVPGRVGLVTARTWAHARDALRRLFG